MKSLKQLREDRKLKPAQVAAKIDRSVACLHDWESGRTSPQGMRFDSAVSLAKVYGISIGELALIIFPENHV